MFDIISWIRVSIFRRPKIVQSIAGEELSEKQTTKMGYFLLFCMFAAILSTAQWSLSIIQDIPDRPTTLPYCVSNMLAFFDEKNETNQNSYNSSYGYQYDNCTLVSPSNPKFDFTTAYNALLPKYTEVSGYAENLSRLIGERSSLESKKRSTRADYTTALTEDIADTDIPVYNSNVVSNSLSNLQKQIDALDTEIQSLSGKIATLKQSAQGEVGVLKDQYEAAKDDYTSAYLWYRMFIALLSLLFSGIVFTLLYKLYLRYKFQNSPHTVIFSVATFAYGLVLMQVLCLFLWDIIPHTFLEMLLGWISVFTPLLFLVQFLWPILIVAIFGYLVYRIQKRLYSPGNILKRFVTDKKCPNCGNAVDMNKPYCPLCSHEIHIHCPSCHTLTMKGMPYCSNCGVGLAQESPTEGEGKAVEKRK